MSSSPNIPWTRYWIPSGQELTVMDGAYTWPPSSWNNSSIATLASCLPASGLFVLCGEPGLGKTSELEKWRLEIGADETVIAIRGREFESMKADVLESETWKKWMQGGERLTVLFDALDEALERLPTILPIVTKHLREGVPLDRLRFVITCRAFEWPEAQGSWQPLKHTDARAVLDHPDRLHVTSDADLKEVLVISLERLQVALKQSPDEHLDPLWRCEGANQARKNFAHNDEAALRDQTKRWLETDLRNSGIFINREVLRRAGSALDLFVELSSPSGAIKYTVVIEVKGCWNPGVQTDIRGQLIDRYLRQNGHRCGIYLVGWFVCPVSPTSKAPKFQSRDAVAARKELDAWIAVAMAEDVDVNGVLLDCSLAGKVTSSISPSRTTRRRRRSPGDSRSSI